MNSMLWERIHIVLLYRPRSHDLERNLEIHWDCPQVELEETKVHIKQLERLGITMRDVYRFSCTHMHLCACAKAGGRHQVSSSIVLNLFYFSFKFLLFVCMNVLRACMYVQHNVLNFWGRVSHGSCSLIGWLASHANPISRPCLWMLGQAWALTTSFLCECWGYQALYPLSCLFFSFFPLYQCSISPFPLPSLPPCSYL